MRVIITIFLLFMNIIVAQNNNERELLKKYSSYKLIRNPKSKFSNWTYKFELNNGKIKSQENYERDILAYKSIFSYDSINSIEYEIKLYDRNNSYKIDTVSIEQKVFNEKRELIKLLFKGKEVKKYSNHNSNGLPQLEESLVNFDFNKIEYTYDSKNNITEKKIYTNYFDEISLKENDSIQIETINFKYNKYNNVIQLKRSFKFPVKFPIIYGGGRSHYESEAFQYEYNKIGLWTKKYWIINGRKLLIEKRKFYK